jgi:hypothetical protein
MKKCMVISVCVKKLNIANEKANLSKGRDAKPRV